MSILGNAWQFDGYCIGLVWGAVVDYIAMCSCAEYCTFAEPLATQKYEIWIPVKCWYIPIECWDVGWGGTNLWYTKLPYKTQRRVKGLMINTLVFLAHYQNINLADRWQQQFLFVFLTFEKLATWNMSSLQQVLEMSIGLYNESDNVCEKNPPSSCYFTIPFNLLLTQSAYFPPSVDMSCWMADCHSTNHLSMVKLVYLSGMSRDTWSDQSIGRKWHSLHLTIATNVEWICRFSSRRAWWKAWSKWRHAYSCCWRAVFKANLPK